MRYTFDAMYYNDVELSELYIGTELVWKGPEHDERKITVSLLDDVHSPTGDTWSFSSIDSAKSFLNDNAGKFYDVYFGNRVPISTIEEYAFGAVPSLYRLVIESKVTRIESYAFNDTPLTSATLPIGLYYLGDGVFKWCEQLESVSLPDTLTDIGSACFYQCRSLSELTIPDFVTRIPEDMCRVCENLETIGLPSSLREIGTTAFQGCTKLSSIEFPNKVTDIGSGAFLNCDSLTNIIIPSSVETIGTFAFGSAGIQTITINKPEGSITGAPWGAVSAAINWVG